MDVSAFARKIWENPIRVEFVVGKKIDGKDDELRLLIRLDPGPKSETLFITSEEVRISSVDRGATIARELLDAVLKAIPEDHKGRDSVMTPAQADRIVRDIKNTGHSTPSEWVAADKKKDLPPTEAPAE